MRSLLTAVLALSTVPTFAQSPAFEVTSVKLHRPGDPMGSRLDAAHLNSSGATLRDFVMTAYHVPAWRLSGGPAWLSTDGWDIAATLPPNMPTDRQELMRETSLMLQALLADRFKLVVHRETKDQPVYELVVAKGGSKLKPSGNEKSSGEKPSVRNGKGHLEFHHMPVSALLNYLYFQPGSGMVDRPVIDKTGLDGLYDFTLDWTPDSPQPDPAAIGPSIFTALEEQTGLKLEPRKVPFEIIVIDHAEKPTEN